MLSLPTRAAYERNPPTLDPRMWREVSDGIYRLKEGLLVVLDVQISCSNFGEPADAALT